MMVGIYDAFPYDLRIRMHDEFEGFVVKIKQNDFALLFSELNEVENI